MCGWRLKKKGGTENQALGRSRGGFSTKIHITVDGLGNPLRMHLTPGQRNDIVEAEALIIGYNSTYVYFTLPEVAFFEQSENVA